VAAGWQQIPVFGEKQQKTTSSLSISGGLLCNNPALFWNNLALFKITFGVTKNTFGVIQNTFGVFPKTKALRF